MSIGHWVYRGISMSGISMSGISMSGISMSGIGMSGIGMSLLLATLSACTTSEPEADAYGNFVAIETTVSAQSDGELLAFDVSEGDQLAVHQVVGQIDTVQLALSGSALLAQREALSAQVASVNAEADVLLEQ